MARFAVSDIYAIMQAVYSTAARTIDENYRLYLIGLAKQLDEMADEMGEENLKEAMKDDNH